MDTVGAILGPAIALSLIGIISLRHIFLISFIPGSITVLIAIFMVKDVGRLPQPHLEIWGSLRALPKTFWRYVSAVGVFGLGNFAHTLLVLRAVILLTPKYGTVMAGRMGVGLYILHNIVYAAVSYPVGVLGDRTNKKQILALGYALFGMMCLLFMYNTTNLLLLAVVFVLAGVYIGIVDSMERAFAADILPFLQRGTGFGALATVNSFGDLLSSILVGVLWNRVSYTAGLGYAAVLTLVGSLLLFLWKPGRGTVSRSSP
jgi:MFS family permease